MGGKLGRGKGKGADDLSEHTSFNVFLIFTILAVKYSTEHNEHHSDLDVFCGENLILCYYKYGGEKHIILDTRPSENLSFLPNTARDLHFRRKFLVGLMVTAHVFVGEMSDELDELGSCPYWLVEREAYP